MRDARSLNPDPGSQPPGCARNRSKRIAKYFTATKPRAAETYGLDYAVKVLDQLNIEVMLANRVALGPGLPSPRFLWVPFADALMYPLPNTGAKNPDQKAFFADAEDTLAQTLLRRIEAVVGEACQARRVSRESRARDARTP